MSDGKEKSTVRKATVQPCLTLSHLAKVFHFMQFNHLMHALLKEKKNW